MRRTSSHSCSLADCRRYRNAMLTWAWTWRTVEFKINNLSPPKTRITFLNFEQYKNKFWENQLCLHFFSSEKQSRLYYFIILFYILLYYFYHVAELQSQKNTNNCWIKRIISLLNCRVVFLEEIGCVSRKRGIRRNPYVSLYASFTRGLPREFVPTSNGTSKIRFSEEKMQFFRLDRRR